MPQRGIFIVIEGLDRSGKTTQTALLYDALKAAGIAVNLLKFPGNTHASNALRPAEMIRQDDFHRKDD